MPNLTSNEQAGNRIKKPLRHGLKAKTELVDTPRRAHFVDVVAVWLIDPLSDDDEKLLRQLCIGRLRKENRKARFNPEYQQRLCLRQPSREALELLTKRNDVHFNYLEEACDLLCRSESEVDDVLQIVCEHSLMIDRRGQKAKVCLGEDGKMTFYSANRGKPDISVTYPTKSKPTGEPAVHTERRISGRQALRKKKLSSIRDLLNSDRVQFWNDHLTLFRIKDFEGLGRAYLNFIERQNNPDAPARRKPRISKHGNFEYNRDKRTGHLLHRALGFYADEQITIPRKAKERDKTKYPGYYSVQRLRSIQNIYDRLNQNVPLRRFMERISLDQLILR